MPVTAQQVKELRQRTGLGMMECKRYLTDSDGDMDAAIAAARKAGVKAKVAGREAGEGRVLSGVSADGKTGVIVTARCNTDFTAKSDVVGELLALMLKSALDGNDPAADEAVKDKAVAAGQSTGENVQAGDVVRLEGETVANYQYTITNKTAALVAIRGGDADLARQIGLHVVANPVRAEYKTRADVPAEKADPAKAAVEAEVEKMGKPPEIADRIRQSKLKVAFAELNVLTDQEFVNQDAAKGTIGDLLKAKDAELIDFKRVQLGG